MTLPETAFAPRPQPVDDSSPRTIAASIGATNRWRHPISQELGPQSPSIRCACAFLVNSIIDFFLLDPAVGGLPNFGSLQACDHRDGHASRLESPENRAPFR